MSRKNFIYLHLYMYLFLGVPLIITVVTAGAANDFLGPKTEDDPQL